MSVFASTTTVAGRNVLQRHLPKVPRALAPLDHLYCVERALSRVAPALLALVETELWPTWIGAAARRQIPVVVVSGRLSDRSYGRYRRVRPLLRRMLGRIEAIGARSQRDAERFIDLGAPAERVSVTGDLKLEPHPPPSADPALVKALSERPCFIAGCTHPGEERAALLALGACERAGIPTTLLLAPRRLDRVQRIERELRRAGRTVLRRSALSGAPLCAGQVLLLDSLGELPSLYALGSAAFVGGTLAPVGGHNLLEPAAAGCPVLFGPHVANVESAAELLLSSGCGQRVRDAEALGVALVRLLSDREASRARVRRGLGLLHLHRGSAARSAALLNRVRQQRPAPG